MKGDLGRLYGVMRLAAFALIIVVTGAIVYCIYCYRIELGLVSQPVNHAGQNTAGYPSGANAGQTNTPAAAQDWRNLNWRMVDRPADGFRVEMPAEVTDGRAPAFTGHGVQEQVPLIEASPRPDNLFAVAWDDDPPVERSAGVSAESTLDWAQSGALARTQAVLTGEWQGHATGYPERDFTGRIAGGGVLKARMILAGRRLFMLLATFPSASAERDEEVNRFFNSFRLTAPARAN
jgi:hypothetical protein